MNEEEAIQQLKQWLSVIDFKSKSNIIPNIDDIQAIEIVINLIKKQQAEIEDLKKSIDYTYEAYQDAGKKMFDYAEELEKKEKIIDELINTIVKLRENSEEDCFIPRSYRDINDCIKTTCKQCIKQYFERKIKEDK